MPEERAGQGPGDDASIKERLRELARTLWDGNLARMARALKLPQPALWKMVNGDQPPSAKLLMALVTRTDINLHWLATGQGPRSLEGEATFLHGQSVVRPKVPVARQLLRGRPEAHADLLDESSPDPLGVLTSTQYWVRVKQTDPVVRHKEERINPGDWLLLEADPAKFPPLDEMEDKLVVVPGRKGPCLARVEEIGEESMEITRFDLGIDPSRLVEEIVIRELPGGKLHAYKRQVLKEQPRRKGLHSRESREVHPGELLYNLVTVKYGGLLAVVVQCLGKP